MAKKSPEHKDENSVFISHILKNLPRKPGVYRFKDSKGKIIYIGKAVNLKNRVSSYFKINERTPVKTRKMVAQISDIDFTVVGSDLEAIMLETNLIKEYKPKYNILMKDDKNFVYLKITVNEDFPRIYITRKVEKDKAVYFGPKTARFKLEKTLKLLKKIFPYRHCGLEIDYIGEDSSGPDHRIKHKVNIKRAVIKYPCIDYHIKRCVAPCIGLVSPSEYKKIIDSIIDFFEGKHEKILNELNAQMLKAAAAKKFESAASIRDKINAIKDIQETQDITAPDHQNLDVINYYASENRFFFNLFQVRSGKLVNQENFELGAKENRAPDENEILTTFIQQYYQSAANFPEQLLIPMETGQDELLEKWLTKTKGSKVSIKVPARGRKDRLLELGYKNAENYARLSIVKWEGSEQNSRTQALQECAKITGLSDPPVRIECYDISHMGGTETTASMVVFDKGFPKKDAYRKFKLHINTPGAPDDYASMKEALTRRFRYLKPSLDREKISVSMFTKKELREFFKTQKKNPTENTLFFKINRNKKKIGQIETHKKNNGKFLIGKISADKDLDLREIGALLMAKLKTKRVYVNAGKSQLPAFEAAGYEPINKIPEDFYPLKNQQPLILLKSKISKDKSFIKKPDVIIVDGGRGQLNVALSVLKEYQLSIPAISIAKKNEEIYLPNQSIPLIYPKDHPFLNMIRHIRDESHRFAVSYQQNLKLKSTVRSTLDEITGIGEKTKQRLLKRFGSTEGIKSATMYELEKTVGKKNALKIKQSL